MLGISVVLGWPSAISYVYSDVSYPKAPRCCRACEFVFSSYYRLTAGTVLCLTVMRYALRWQIARANLVRIWFVSSLSSLSSCCRATSTHSTRIHALTWHVVTYSNIYYEYKRHCHIFRFVCGTIYLLVCCMVGWVVNGGWKEVECE